MSTCDSKARAGHRETACLCPLESTHDVESQLPALSGSLMRASLGKP